MIFCPHTLTKFIVLHVEFNSCMWKDAASAMLWTCFPAFKKNYILLIKKFKSLQIILLCIKKKASFNKSRAVFVIFDRHILEDIYYCHAPCQGLRGCPNPLFLCAEWLGGGVLQGEHGAGDTPAVPSSEGRGTRGGVRYWTLAVAHCCISQSSESHQNISTDLFCIITANKFCLKSSMLKTVLHSCQMLK